MKVVIALLVLILCTNATCSNSPVDFFRQVIRGFFLEFEEDNQHPLGCYFKITHLYEDIALLIDQLKYFNPKELPHIAAAITDIIYRCIDLDVPCQYQRVFNATRYIIQHKELIKTRINLLALLTILNNIQKGCLTDDYEALGRGVGFFLRKILDMQIQP